ncbi:MULTISPECIES: hypothetical protein [unclassified Bradyrhizobium]|uniref:hypothetical protein n=1 Tax=Bradyrhizobium sp. USDA 4541 TaxID=2817704 RepID=UPI0020A432D6|nr:hypothetical protein [Bradyrhizobium sp. USDA 4541]MCP1846776.1 hypothetical protein [Bradyrhizobium sp. USDA 4541]
MGAASVAINGNLHAQVPSQERRSDNLFCFFASETKANASVKPGDPRQFIGLVIGMLADGQLEFGRNAVIADRGRRATLDEIAHILQNGHSNPTDG